MVLAVGDDEKVSAKRIRVNPITTGDARICDPRAMLAMYYIAIATDCGVHLATADWSSEFDSGCLFVRECFAGTLRDKIAFDFCGKAKCECSYLGIQVLTEVEIVLYGADADVPFATVVEHTHYHENISSKTRNFSAYQQVAGLHPADCDAKFTARYGDRTVDGLFYPFVYHYIMGLYPVFNFKFLARAGLLVSADPYIRIIHNRKTIKCDFSTGIMIFLRKLRGSGGGFVRGEG